MILPSDLNKQVEIAIKTFWLTRDAQLTKSMDQNGAQNAEQGYRNAVTGGKQMDGLVNLIKKIVIVNGIYENEVFTDSCLELPGYYRPTKKWDILIIAKSCLLAAIELKSQVGPSFGNNFNNRTEEAMGSALDIWTAFREGAFGKIPPPWLGYLFLLEDCDSSNTPVGVSEPHFKVFNEFKKASYSDRYEIFCRKLVTERNYCSACFIKSPNTTKGIYSCPRSDLNFNTFITSLLGQISVFTTQIGRKF